MVYSVRDVEEFPPACSPLAKAEASGAGSRSLNTQLVAGTQLKLHEP